ncbi:MAG: sodium:solute symporter [Gammaproteobacteria bacterium]|nr:sodium:solute symporter [Gammaproteobacteria bacterium]MBT8110525.1 sodium:solute symporter [Gammaproteobacteria bacterium]NND48058.1 sodium/solute symporter [Woeseiaceae bacterium]NNL45225.1 sodium/solute symporter [Woeseiaceae bacterium]
MNTFDFIIVFGYLVMLLGLGYFFKEQKSKQDYFLGGREMGVFPLTLSTMATQLSAISFISAPAFVGLRPGGGMVWLSYEFAVPIAMLFLMVYVLPALYRSGVVSIYDFLEQRFGVGTRLLISVVFQVSRAFATGVTIYATALILNSVMGIDFMTSIAIIGVVTIIYSLQGGMKAVVWSDTIQMILIFFGVIVVGGFALYNLGGVDAFLANVDTTRLTVLRTDSFGFSGDEWGLMPMIFGGFVLYASYYGCDQTQAQRTLSAKSEATVRTILLANGLARFPIVFLYCTAGLILGTFAAMNPEFLSQIDPERPDTMVPLFIVNYLPHGIIGILVVALLAAAMSSLSSVVNSLSAVLIEDYVRLTGKELQQERYVFWSRVTVFFWGIVIVVLSIYAGDIAPTVIEAINKVGSVFYGPILAIFLLAILFKKVHSLGANVGLLTGVGVNVYMWLGAPHIFWLWWNFIGCVVTLSVALIISAIRHEESTAPPGLDQGVGHWFKHETIVLIGAFIGMLAIGALVPVIFG